MTPTTGPEPGPEPADPVDRMPRWLLAVALGLSLALVVGVLVAAAVVRNREPGPLRLVEIPAPQAGSAECARLVERLPEELDGGELGQLPRRELIPPAPQGAAAWGEPPVTLRCGLGRPDQLTVSSRLLDVSGVQFLEVPGPGAASWVAVDRPVYVVVTLPDELGSAPVQQIADIIRETLPEQEIDLRGG